MCGEGVEGHVEVVEGHVERVEGHVEVVEEVGRELRGHREGVEGWRRS